MTRFILNEKTIATDLPPGTPLLDFIRYQQRLTGTKIGCREGDCGACTVLVGEIKNDKLVYQSMTSCLMPLGNAQGKHIVSIEGINFPNKLNPVQQAMADEGATQCGFCTPGFIMSLAGFCLSHAEANTQQAIAAIDGNICRCTGYKSIERAAAKIATQLQQRKGEDPVTFVTESEMLPGYFRDIKARLEELAASTASLSSDVSFVVGGGTDLYVQKHDELKDASIRFVFDQPNLNYIEQEGNRCLIGASTSVSDLKNAPLINRSFPLFQQYAKLVSSTPIRNMATVAGNFVNASPIGDLTIIFLALDAELVLRSEPQTAHSEGRVRVIPLRKFYKGYKQLDKRPEEHIEQVSFELPGEGHYFHFEKISKRMHLDIASVNTAIHLKIKDGIITQGAISAGGVGPVPMYLEKASAFLVGKKISKQLVEEVIAVLRTEISPISDARGSKEYKALLLSQLIKAHFSPLL